MLTTKKEGLFVFLTGIFITNAIVAELVGGKLIFIGGFLLSLGILPWPIVFLTTDLLNEYFGAKVVKRLSFITAGLISYTFILLSIGLKIPVAEGISPVSNSQFSAVFGQSQYIIIGSILAFLFSQLVDSSVFHFVKNKTGSKMIWFRATLSTIISQFFDSFIVLGIGFLLPGKITFSQYISSGFSGYLFKLMVAAALIPLIYISHNFVKNKFLHLNQH